LTLESFFWNEVASFRVHFKVNKPRIAFYLVGRLLFIKPWRKFTFLALQKLHYALEFVLM